MNINLPLPTISLDIVLEKNNITLFSGNKGRWGYGGGLRRGWDNKGHSGQGQGMVKILYIF